MDVGIIDSFETTEIDVNGTVLGSANKGIGTTGAGSIGLGAAFSSEKENNIEVTMETIMVPKLNVKVPVPEANTTTCASKAMDKPK